MPARQALKAFATWLGDPRASRTAARQVAREILQRLDNSHATNTARRTLQRVVESAAYTGCVDLDELRTVVREVFEGAGRDPDRFLGYADARVTAAAVVDITQANLVAIDLVRCGGLTDAFLHQARQQLLAGEEAYVAQYAQLAGAAPDLYEPPTPQEALSGCCSCLLTTIGFMLMSEDRSS
ncbi:MAG: hypothetical protein K6T37_04125 [Acidothermus cellulolyticus]|nr:hypothetical protein [Acidothermus cellulolyticus]